MRILLNFPDGLPKGTSQQKGVRVVNGKPYFYRKNKIDSARTRFVLSLKQYAPKVPSDRPIKLSIWFFFDVKEKCKWKRWKTTRPDADGYVKEFLDAMGDCGFFQDDSQIVDLRVRKSYAERGEILIEMEELGDMP